MKAINDGDVKKSFTSYKATYDTYVTASEDYITSAEKVLPAVAECENVETGTSSDVATMRSVLAKCKARFTGVADLKDKDLREFATGYIAFIDSMDKALASVANIASGDYTAASKARSDIYAAQDKITDSVKSTNSNIEKRFKDMNLSEASYDLKTVLFNKSIKK